MYEFICFCVSVCPIQDLISTKCIHGNHGGSCKCCCYEWKRMNFGDSVTILEDSLNLSTSKYIPFCGKGLSDVSGGRKSKQIIAKFPSTKRLPDASLFQDCGKVRIPTSVLLCRQRQANGGYHQRVPDRIGVQYC